MRYLSFWRLVAGSVSALAVSLLLLEPAAATKTEKGWKLVQKCDPSGQFHVVIARTGVKITNSKAFYSLVIVKPDYKIHLFNDRTKAIFESPLANWHGGLGENWVQLNNARFGDLTRKIEQGDSDFEGLKLHRSHFTRPDEMTHETKQEMRGMFNVKAITYWTTDSLPVPPAVCNAVQRFYHVPESKGFPVRCIHKKTSGKRIEDLKTMTCEKVDLPADTFKIPTGYKRVKKDTDVVLNNEQVGDMVNELLGQ